MVDFYDSYKIVALLDKPSAESFGICPIITRGVDTAFYEVLGLSSGVKTIPKMEFERLYGGHILRVDSSLPKDLSNPVALWLGHQFCLKAENLQAPSPPKTDETWLSPLEPDQERGRYKIESSSEAYEVIEGWVTAAGITALTRSNYDLAKLMNWALPDSPITQAALYFTAPTYKDKQKELKWQLKMKRDITIGDLIQIHERTKRELINSVRVSTKKFK